ncbi:MAG: hypothetical protein QM820_11795 [Minicystis sp.]
MKAGRSPYRRERFELAAFRERVRARLSSRFGLRLHMTLVVMLVFTVAFVTERGLLWAGMTSMAVRYLAASITGYAAFFGLLRVWLWYVTEEAGHELAPDHAPDEVALAIDPSAEPRSAPPLSDPFPAATAPRRAKGKSGGNASGFDLFPDIPTGGGSSSNSGGGGGFDLGDGDGCVVVIIVAIVAVIAAALFGAAAYVIYQAPTLLGEAAFELVLASVLARSSRRVTRDGWSGSVLAATWKPALGLLLVATIGGFAAQGLCPGEITMRGVIKHCVLDRKKS